MIKEILIFGQLNKKITFRLLFLMLFKRLNASKKFQFKLLLLLSVLVALLELCSLGALLPFLGMLTSTKNYENNRIIVWAINYFSMTGKNAPLILFASIFGIFIFFSTVMRLLLLKSTTWLCHTVGSDISKDIYRANLYQKYSLHISQNSSDVISAISSKVDLVINGEIIPLCNMITSLTMLTIVLIALLFYNSLITIILIFSFSLIYLLIMKFTKKMLSTASNKMATESSNSVRILQEGLGGIRDVIIGGFQESYVKIFSEADHGLRASQGKVAFLSQYPRFLIEGLAMLLVTTLALIIVVGSKNNAGLSVIPILGVYALAAQRLLPVTQGVYAAWAHINGNKGALIDVVKLLCRKESTRIECSGKRISIGEIEMSNMSFSYSPNSALILDSVSFKIPRGARVGIIGRTGSGKSTLVDILMGLLHPSSGKFMVNGQTIDELNASEWQAYLAHVPQAIFLADATIEENIAFSVPKEEIDRLHLRNVAKIAQIDEDIQAWPERYETRVGERGVKLSGGQRQRIGIARALYKKAGILFFDEATSALDSKTEQLIIDGIESFDRETKKNTVFMVSHRLSTLKNCTHILEVENKNVNIRFN